MAEDGADRGEPDGAAGFPWDVFARSLMAAFSVPAAVLFATALGFGALARDGGFSLAQTAFITTSMFALPNQVLLVDHLARNGTAIAAAFAVSLAALRLLPMTVTVIPLFKGRRRRPLLELLAVHFVAITPWLEAKRRLPALPVDARLAGHLGLGFGLSGTMLAGALAGHALAGSVPPAVSGTFLFLTPVYFLLSLLATSQSRMDFLAIGLGCGLAPAFYAVMPGFDLLATGLAGGTLAFVLRRGRRRRA